MTKIIMQDELVRIWAEENVTMIMVTHDLEEAVYLTDRQCLQVQYGAVRLPA